MTDDEDLDADIAADSGNIKGTADKFECDAGKYVPEETANQRFPNIQALDRQDDDNGPDNDHADKHETDQNGKGGCANEDISSPRKTTAAAPASSASAPAPLMPIVAQTIVPQAQSSESKRRLREMGSKESWFISFCHANSVCLASIVCQSAGRRGVPTKTTRVPVSGVFLVGPIEREVASNGRCVKLPGVTAACGVDVHFQIEACCHSSCSAVAEFCGPSYEELLTHIESPTAFWNYLVASCCVCYMS